MEYVRYSENKGHLFIFEYVFPVSDHNTYFKLASINYIRVVTPQE